MKKLKQDIVKGIKGDLGIDLNEAYVVSEKKFNVRTDALSSETILKHNELLNGYVKTLNRVSSELDTANREDAGSGHSVYRSLKIDEVYNINGAFLHGMYFDNIGSQSSKVSVDSLTYMRLERDFGSFNDWQRDFIACAMSSRNGWAITVYNTFLKRYINVVVDLHSLNIPFSSYPIIVLDMWEHAYYRDYLNDKKKYVFAMMKELNWDVIEARVQKAEDVAEVYK